MMRSWPNFKTLSRHLSAVTEGNHEQTSFGIAVSGPIFEPRTSRIRSMSVNHSTVTFDKYNKEIHSFFKIFVGYYCVFKM
jgi:hypothetical protein